MRACIERMDFLSKEAEMHLNWSMRVGLFGLLKHFSPLNKLKTRAPNSRAEKHRMFFTHHGPPSPRLSSKVYLINHGSHHIFWRAQNLSKEFISAELAHGWHGFGNANCGRFVRAVCVSWCRGLQRQRGCHIRRALACNQGRTRNADQG